MMDVTAAAPVSIGSIGIMVWLLLLIFFCEMGLNCVLFVVLVVDEFDEADCCDDECGNWIHG